MKNVLRRSKAVRYYQSIYELPVMVFTSLIAKCNRWQRIHETLTVGMFISGYLMKFKEYTHYKLINVIKPKPKKRKQAMIFISRLWATVIDGPLMDLYILGGKILDNDPAYLPVHPDRMFVYIDEIDENDDPDDVSCWGKANPSLGVLLDKDDLIDEWEAVKLVPCRAVKFYK